MNISSDAPQGVKDLPRPLIGLIPGAARGPSKRWPVEHFATLALLLASQKNASLVLFGTEQEKILCDEIFARVPKNALNLAGQTNLETWAASLRHCDAVVCNDSGGMHLASALGIPLIAIYGMTDPSKTGPLGSKAKVIQDSLARSRDIAEHSHEAEKSLAAIRPERVYEAVQECLNAR